MPRHTELDDMLANISENIWEFQANARAMRRRKKTKYIHEGAYVAAVDVTLMDDEKGWSPYLSVADACKLDDVRDALRRGDLRSAAQYGQIYELRLVANL